MAQESIEDILKSCSEPVDAEYRLAMAKGRESPVIFLNAVDPKDPDTIEVSHWRAEALSEKFRDSCPALAEELATVPPPAGHFYLVLVHEARPCLESRPIPSD